MLLNTNFQETRLNEDCSLQKPLNSPFMEPVKPWGRPVGAVPPLDAIRDKKPSRATRKQPWFTPCHLYRRLFIQAWCIIASSSPEGVTFAAPHVCKGAGCVRAGTWRPVNLAHTHRYASSLRYFFSTARSLASLSDPTGTWWGWNRPADSMKKMIDVRLCTRMEGKDGW